ncbi:hypothetical protein L3081_11260 [Colwellia sp. MSW7]|uniref:Uncharacterized protein n=1 Tax=Colwellia maritima TaxID=2912588 RepID=A0ABS9X251_9GAMM|nr:hypothetical protein [Colwellia maritima]MCI2283872.1 hypothetical protein [Colwellia maritima]
MMNMLPSIVETGGKFYVAFNSNDGTYTEVCFLKIDNDADLVTDFGLNGVRCTTEKSSLSVNDTAYNGKDIFAVGKVEAGDNNLLVIQIDKDGDFIDHTPGDLADSPHIMQDISGINLNDEGMAVYNPNNNEILVVGNVETSDGDKDVFAWLLDEDGIAMSTFNGGNARFYDVNSTDDTVNAAVSKKESDFTAHLVGATVLANGKKEALIIALDKTSDLETNFGGSGIVTYDADGDLGAGTGSSEFTDIVFEGSKLYVSGTLFDSQTKQFATHIKMSDGTIDDEDLPASGYKKISYGGDSAFAQSISLDGHKTMWLSGYVEAGGETDMIISAVDDEGDLCNNDCENDFADGKETFSHSALLQTIV